MSHPAMLCTYIGGWGLLVEKAVLGNSFCPGGPKCSRAIYIASFKHPMRCNSVLLWNLPRVILAANSFLVNYTETFLAQAQRESKRALMYSGSHWHRNFMSKIQFDVFIKLMFAQKIHEQNMV